ncbi:15542_t:CDS:2, partial [Acaulospora colombiana]
MEFNDDDASLALALKLQEEENNSSNQLSNVPENKLARDLDSSDPNPDLHSLFIAFDRQYFWGSLQSVE